MDESRVTINISPRDRGCELALTHELDADWADYADRTREGWSHMLDALVKVLE